MELKYTKSNYGRVVLAGLIDAALTLSILFFYLKNFEIYPLINEYPNISVWLSFALYRLITIVLFNATLGMRFLGLTFLKENEENLSLIEKFLAGVFILYEGVDYYREVKEIV